MICALLAVAGIATQPSFQAIKGLHGSTLFTLSMPVSRFRLLGVRTSVGWLEGAAAIAALCCGMWLVSPLLRAAVTKVEMFEYAGTLIACASALYCLSVLLATFPDDQRRVWGTMIGSAALWWLSTYTPRFRQHLSSNGKGFAPDRTHHAVDCDGILPQFGRNLILCGDKSCANPRVLIPSPNSSSVNAFHLVP
jgi:hypothetical protein